MCQALGQTWWKSSWFSWDPQWSLVFVSFLILKRLTSQSIWAQMGTSPLSSLFESLFRWSQMLYWVSSIYSLPWSSGNTQSLTTCSHTVSETNMDTHCGYIQSPHCRKIGQKQEKEQTAPVAFPSQAHKSGCGSACSHWSIYSHEMQYITLTGCLVWRIFFSANHFEHFRKNCSRITDFLLRQKVWKRCCLLKNWRNWKTFKIA